MMPKQLDRNSGLMSCALKNLGLSAGVGVLLASPSAFALNNNQASANTFELAQATQGQTQPQSSKPDTKTSNQPRFSCQFVNGQYTVMYAPETQPGQSYAWANPSALGGGWTPEKRCNEISRRLELYRPDGLQEMQTAVENNYNIVCVTTQKDRSCRIVLTVPPGQDAQITRDRVFQNLTVADSGKETDAVNTFVGGERNSQLLDRVVNQGLSALGIGNNSLKRSSINLRPFLDTADGGTGSQLRRGTPTRSNPQLNPDRFR